MLHIYIYTSVNAFCRRFYPKCTRVYIQSLIGDQTHDFVISGTILYLLSNKSLKYFYIGHFMLLKTTLTFVFLYVFFL